MSMSKDKLLQMAQQREETLNKKEDPEPTKKKEKKLVKTHESKSPVKELSKHMEDNPASLMFYLPEQMKEDLFMAARKEKKSVAIYLREIISNELYN